MNNRSYRVTNNDVIHFSKCMHRHQRYLDNLINNFSVHNTILKATVN